MNKYEPLANYLRSRAGAVSLSISDVDNLVGGLPASARRYRQWWANDPSHVQARAWLEGGFRTESVDFPSERVLFVSR